MAKVPLYDDLSSTYDRFVNWPARLAYELPRLEAMFAGHDVHRVMDVACGTGQHVLALAERGYEAAGADLSRGMIEQARARAAARGLDAPFAVAGFGELAAVFPGPFDALLCLGNSLPHLLSLESLRAALADFARVLRPGGLLVAQNRNYDRVWGAQERFMPLQSQREGEQEWLFFRFMDFHEATLTFNVVTLHRTGEQWSYTTGATELRPLFQEEMARLLAEAGFRQAAFYGSYDREVFEAGKSGDLVVVATK